MADNDQAYSDPDTDELFASPKSRADKKAQREHEAAQAQKGDSKSSSTAERARTRGESNYDNEHAREQALRAELEGVRGINEVIEGVVSSLERAKGNMEVSTERPMH
jgi:hypothetical protein